MIKVKSQFYMEIIVIGSAVFQDIKDQVCLFQ